MAFHGEISHAPSRACSDPGLAGLPTAPSWVGATARRLPLVAAGTADGADGPQRPLSHGTWRGADGRITAPYRRTDRGGREPGSLFAPLDWPSAARRKSVVPPGYVRGRRSFAGGRTRVRRETAIREGPPGSSCKARTRSSGRQRGRPDPCRPRPVRGSGGPSRGIPQTRKCLGTGTGRSDSRSDRLGRDRLVLAVMTSEMAIAIASVLTAVAVTVTLLRQVVLDRRRDVERTSSRSTEVVRAGFAFLRPCVGCSY